MTSLCLVLKKDDQKGKDNGKDKRKREKDISLSIYPRGNNRSRKGGKISIAKAQINME